MRRASFEDPRYFLNRHLSWLGFNRRVLEEATDPANPLLERVKFLGITASNLDEFVEVRVAGLLQQAEKSRGEIEPDGMTPAELLPRLASELQAFVRDQYRCWREGLVPGLEHESIRVRKIDDLTPDARKVVEKFYSEQVEPILTPVTVDPAHPFPRVLNKALCVAFLLRRRRRSSMAYTGVVTVPRALPRLIRLPSKTTADFIFLADLVAFHAARMYQGYDIVSSAAFRVTRNSNLYLAEEESRNLLESVRTELHNRRKGDAVRLEIEA